MRHFSTQLIFVDINTISIPIDAILIVFLLLVFYLLGYFLNKISNDTIYQLSQRIDIDSTLEAVKKKLEDQLTLEETTLDLTNREQSRIKK